MAVRTWESNINVLDAAKIRIKNLFDTGAKIYISFSSGKDSLCVASLTYDLILSGEINKDQLAIIFVDEEGLYQSMVDQAMLWRNKFEKIGVPFLWLCLPFKQASILNSLSFSESWITWEPGKEDCWMRTPPPFAITSHPILEYAGQMNYQTFCSKAFNDGIAMIGTRAAESYTRVKAFANVNLKRSGGKFYPIYDWKDTDVWRYIKERNLQFPEAYMWIYETGTPRNRLRLCQFFGDGGSGGLKRIAETDPELWEKIEKREPNAYLATLYWDSEMFGRKTRQRTKLEKDQEKKDYKALVEDILWGDTDKYKIGNDTKKHLGNWRGLFVKMGSYAQEWDYKRAYEALIFGDPKSRALRMMWADLTTNLHDIAEREDKERTNGTS